MTGLEQLGGHQAPSCADLLRAVLKSPRFCPMLDEALAPHNAALASVYTTEELPQKVTDRFVPFSIS